MTKNEFKRLKNFVHHHNQTHIDNWHGWLTLHKSYAEKHELHAHQTVSNLSETKSELFKFPAKHIQSVNLWISHGRKHEPIAYF